MKPRHIMNFSDFDTLLLDRVCRMLRDMDLNYVVTRHPESTDWIEDGKALWVTSRISNPLHIEAKARAIGIAYAISHESSMVGMPKAQFEKGSIRDFGQFVTLPSELRVVQE
jgi:hypothetical protein